jgi:hypothetical protein
MQFSFAEFLHYTCQTIAHVQITYYTMHKAKKAKV